MSADRGVASKMANHCQNRAVAIKPLQAVITFVYSFLQARTGLFFF
jgi:hypothetical protein